MTLISNEWEFEKCLRTCFPIIKMTAPFGLNQKTLPLILEDKPNWIAPPQVITNQESKEVLENAGFDVMVWKNMHAKVLIGFNGAIWGSWNFNFQHSKKATRRELIEFVPTTFKKYKQLDTQFDAWWDWQKHNCGDFV